VLVVLDEAYREFVTDPDVPDGLTLLPRWPNLVALRTFSKAYRLAGFRVGYAIGSSNVIDALRKVHPALSVSTVVAPTRQTGDRVRRALHTGKGHRPTVCWGRGASHSGRRGRK
jgi:histidinol-phosphate/aromatic aminotransferase/cobyric acid decarboxylase-like protein